MSENHCTGHVDYDAEDARNTKCDKCGESYQVVRPGKIQPSCNCEFLQRQEDQIAALTAELSEAKRTAYVHYDDARKLERQVESLTAERDEARKEREEAERKYRLAKAMVDSARTVLGSAAAEENARYYMERQRAEKAEAEVARLRALVEAAYREAKYEERTIGADYDAAWTNSDAKRAADGAEGDRT